MATPFLPRTDSDLILWFNNFQTKLLGYAATLGLVAADTTAATNDYNALAYMVNMADAIKTQQQDRVGFKDLLRDGPIGAIGGAYPGAYTPPAAPAVVAPGILPRLRLLVKRLKAHPAYTVAIGEDLGIVAPALPPVGFPSLPEVREPWRAARCPSRLSRSSSPARWWSLGAALRRPGRTWGSSRAAPFWTRALRSMRASRRFAPTAFATCRAITQ